jgi:hypothetical protein
MACENKLESKGGRQIELMSPHIHWERRNQEKALSWTVVNINE